MVEKLGGLPRSVIIQIDHGQILRRNFSHLHKTQADITSNRVVVPETKYTDEPAVQQVPAQDQSPTVPNSLSASRSSLPNISNKLQKVKSSRVTVLQGDILPHHGRCEPITIPFCKQIIYNQTIFPNLLNHVSQEDAGPDIHQFTPLIKVNCSPDLKFFLCTVYAPVCTILDRPIPPCRHLCESAREKCDEIMIHFGFAWPEHLECSKFPIASDEKVICVGDNNATHESRRPLATKMPKVDYKSNIEKDPSKLHGAKDYGFVCPIQFKVPKGLDYSLKVGDKVELDCGAPCNDMFFTGMEKQFARLWIGIWATLCALSCLFTVMTFLIDTDRFRYPERPIIFLSVCYLMVAATYVMGWGAGDSVSCRGPFPPPVTGTRLPNVTVITQGTKHEPCTILFMVLYFFSMASSIWWVILTLTWFLAAGLKWGHEAIEANSQYFHLAAWAVPAIKTISILATGKVDGYFDVSRPPPAARSCSLCGPPARRHVSPANNPKEKKNTKPSVSTLASLERRQLNIQTNYITLHTPKPGFVFARNAKSSRSYPCPEFQPAPDLNNRRPGDSVVENNCWILAAAWPAPLAGRPPHSLFHLMYFAHAWTSKIKRKTQAGAGQYNVYTENVFSGVKLQSTFKTVPLDNRGSSAADAALAKSRNAAVKKEGSESVIPAQYIIRSQFRAAAALYGTAAKIS
ncbi:Frizzled [Eumeta japonica]|uniref:Frizzled n=1 Tax=Eumeta variegata TaxID=151549 RepID=A0A4C1ZMM3_EUMVA|nr:Frizzled [Eumeta japonica]